MAGSSTNITFRKPFAEQLAAFRLKLDNLVPTSRWDDVWKAQHDRAGMVAGATKAELIGDILGAVYKSMEQGTTFDQFQKDFRDIVQRHGWHGWTGEGSAKGEAWRMRVIYKTNMRTSYMAGRWAQLQRPIFKFWIYRHGGSVEPRLHHLSWDGLVLERGHPFWTTHFPPNGWGCSCEVFGAMSRDHAARKGGNLSKKLPDNWQAIDPKTGEPKGIGRGWGYAPGASAVEDVQLGAQMLAKMPSKVGADFARSIQPRVDDAWSEWLSEVKAGTQFDATLLGHIEDDLQRALSDIGRSPSSAEIMIAPNVVVGAKATRHVARGDALTDEDWLRLPERLRQPKAVLLDNRSGNILFLLDGTERAPQLAVALNYSRRRDGQINLVRSAYRPKLADIVGRVAGGLLTLLLGSV